MSDIVRINGWKGGDPAKAAMVIGKMFHLEQRRAEAAIQNVISGKKWSYDRPVPKHQREAVLATLQKYGFDAEFEREPWEERTVVMQPGKPSGGDDEVDARVGAGERKGMTKKEKKEQKREKEVAKAQAADGGWQEKLAGMLPQGKKRTVALAAGGVLLLLIVGGVAALFLL